MKQTALSQLAIVSAGQAAPKDDEFSNHGTPFVRAGSLDSLLSGKTESDLELVSDEIAKQRKLKTYPKGTILFAKSGMSATKDRVYKLNSPACVVSHLATLIPNGNVDADYLRLALKRFPPSVLIKDLAYPAISLGDIQSYEIPLPEQFDDQIRITHLLCKVEVLIAQRQQLLQQLNDLLHSLFLEMFGDIRAQKSSHPWVALRPYLKANSGKSSKGVISDRETGIPIFGGNGINGWATQSLYETPVVIAGRVGQQCGVIHVSKGPCWVTDNAIVLSISDDSQLNVVYLAKAFQYAPIRERVKQLDLPFINQPMLLDYPLPLPPIDLQNRFAAIVAKVESIKTQYQQGLVNLETLYGALSQQAFNGDLDLSRVPLLGIQPEKERRVTTESLRGVAEQSLSIYLPDICDLLDAVQGPVRQQDILKFWLEAYRGQLGNTLFSIQEFMDAAQTRLTELHLEADFLLGSVTYEHIKTWVFDQIGSRKLKQTRDIIFIDEKRQFGNKLLLRARKLPQQ